MSKFIIVADLNDSTPFEVLYGTERLVFDTAAEAEAQAESLTAEPLWGPQGDLTAFEAGFNYEVREVEEDELAEGGEFEAWGQ